MVKIDGKGQLANLTCTLPLCATEMFPVDGSGTHGLLIFDRDCLKGLISRGSRTLVGTLRPPWMQRISVFAVCVVYCEPRGWVVSLSLLPSAG